MPIEDRSTWIFQDWNTDDYDLSSSSPVTESELAPFEAPGDGLIVGVMLKCEVTTIVNAAGARFGIYRHPRDVAYTSSGTKIGESEPIPELGHTVSSYNSGPYHLRVRPVAGQTLAFQKGDGLRMLTFSPRVSAGQAETRMLGLINMANRPVVKVGSPSL